MNFPDTLKITHLKVTTNIGVYEWEQRIQQTLYLDIVIPIKPAQHDVLSSTLDYEDLCHQVSTRVNAKSFQLIETVANEVASFIKTTFDVAEIEITVHKPHAIKEAQGISVTVKR